MTTPIYGSTKTYTHSIGLSCAFRQWRANSHCRFIHGYALEITLDFRCDPTQRDDNGWVVDFGGLKAIKAALESAFDHKLVVAASDPELETLLALQKNELAEVTVMQEVGCEAFAEYVYNMVRVWLANNTHRDVQLHRVTVREHAGNSAYIQAPQDDSQ